MVGDRIAYGGRTLWEVDGRPVSMAGVTRTVERTARVAPVHTPADERGHGCAAGITAEVSRRARPRGAHELFLLTDFTDFSGPTGDARCRRLGYRPVEDHLVLSFGGARGRAGR